MWRNRKKVIMLIVVMVSLISAGFITFSNIYKKSTYLNELKGEIVLLKCRNSECNYTFEMDMKDYYEYLQNNRSNTGGVTALPCPKCGQKSAYEAIKCVKCGNIFFVNRIKRDFFDRCPKCGFSKEEKQREDAN